MGHPDLAQPSTHAGGWTVTDLHSAQGTYLNGHRLHPSVPTPFTLGDLLRIPPWTFRVAHPSAAVSPAPTTTQPPADDDALRTHRIERIRESGGGGGRPGVRERLRLLTDGLARLHTLPSDAALAKAALDSVLAGTGCGRGAVLRRVGGPTEPDLVEPIESVGIAADESSISCALIRAAAAGEVAVLTRTSAAMTSGSICDLGIHSAICAPVHLAGSVIGYLYLDARGREAGLHPDAAGFCEAVARAYGLALANLQRAELERRRAALAAELEAAHEAQQFIMPPTAGRLGFLSYAMQMRPGAEIAGDLFDVVPLEDGRVAVCLGDVSGHGAGSAMVMAAAQSHINAHIRASGDPAQAVTAANRYLAERCIGGRFVSLWLGVFSPCGRLTYVDAGHGHWMMHTPPSTASQGSDQPVATAAPSHSHAPPKGIPIGIGPDAIYFSHELTLTSGQRVVLFSDGIVEQRNPAGEEFGQLRLRAALARSGSVDSDVTSLFRAVQQFAARATLDDDATAASIGFGEINTELS